MLDPVHIRENPDAVRDAVRLKGDEADVDGWLRLDRERRDLLQEVDQLRSTRNKVSEAIARLKKAKEDASDPIAEMRKTGDRIKEIDQKLRATEKKLHEIAIRIPNIPDGSVPHGGESANLEVRVWGKPRSHDFEAKTHWEIGEELGIIDFARASRISGPGFPILMGAGALLQRALIRFMIDLHIREHGYFEVYAPFLVNEVAMFGTGQLPKLEADMYFVERDNLFLIPTGEVPITNLHQNEILAEEDLPVKYVGYTACFRREAGAAGRETRGLNRLHQFDKVEMVRFTKPEDSYDALEELLGNAEEVLKRLELPYRVLLLATGDLSFASTKTYDIEVWAPGQERWLEVSSCSNFEAFQTRRIRARYRPTEGKSNRPLHTLNGSGLALPRTLIALIEHYQRKDGKVDVPAALRPYMDGLETIG